MPPDRSISADSRLRPPSIWGSAPSNEVPPFGGWLRVAIRPILSIWNEGFCGHSFARLPVRARARERSVRADGNPEIAALQVGLRKQGLYAGTVDGVLGPGTADVRFGSSSDGPVSPPTAFPARARGRRSGATASALRSAAARSSSGQRGWDVAALQFALAWHGFPSGSFDGRFGSHTDAALRGFQRWAGITPDGVAGPATIAALRGPVPRSPLSMARPLIGPVGDVFGPRGNRFHAGLDFPAPTRSRGRRGGSGTGRLRGPGRQRLGHARRGRPRQRRPHALRAPLASGGRARRARPDRVDDRPRRLDRGVRPVRTSTSRCSCGARTSIRCPPSNPRTMPTPTA